MLCPIDGETLLMTAREGVEIDYCPRCRGVWLDRGELDKIIERAGGMHKGAAFSPAPNAFQEKVDRHSHPKEHHRSDDDDDRRKRSKYKSRDFYRKSKTKSFLKEIFDFD